MTPHRPLSLSLLSLALGAALSAPAHAQSLLELVESARTYDTTWQSARAQLDAASRRADQARAGLLPSAALTAGLSRANVELSRPPVENTGTTQTVGVQASQPLYRPANRITLEQGQRGIDVAQAQLDAATQDLLGRASQARYDLVVAQEIAAENDLRVKRLALDQLVGITGTKPQPLALPVQLPTVQPDNVTTWVDTARDQQPGVRQAAIALDIARLETKKAETGHLPTLDLQVGYNVTRNPNGTITAPGVNNRTNSASVGVAFNLPLFAGFAVQNRVKETLALEEKASADLETTRRNVAQATRAAFFGVQSGQGQVQALEAAEASSQSALDANKLGYQVGVRINIDVLNAQSQLFQTKRDLAQARYNVLLGTLKLRQAAGTLTQQDIEAINALLVK